jgi:N-acetylglucosaminyl-diphospho-decaprenol L-rhamnosyltransferase
VPDLSIIIVSWNVADLLADCLDSIAAHTGNLDIETIVVDSASRDDTVSRVQTSYPWVTLLPQTENVGFAGGNNIGLEHATGEFLLLLNPDTVIVGEMLAQMVAYLRANPAVGVVGPHTLNTDGSTQSSRRRFPTLATAFFESTWLQPYAPGALLNRYYVRDADDSATLEVDWVQGHALMTRHTVYEQVGGLDTKYPMYFEETDWCQRVKSAGWRVVYLGSAQVIHLGGGSSAQAGAFKHISYNRSKIRYVRRYHSPVAALLLRGFLLAGFAWQWVLEGAKWLIRHKPTLRRERLRVYGQVLRSGL